MGSALGSEWEFGDILIATQAPEEHVAAVELY